MRNAPPIDGAIGIIQTLPLIFFTAVVILLVRMVFYTRPMEQFYWSSGGLNADYFSYYKMAAIIICAAVVLIFILYRVFTKTLAIKRTFLYIPMLAYLLFVILSYVFSEYREFALLGFNGRFEGTLTLISYMVMLFYAINTINSEKNVKYIVYPIAASGFLLSLLGISQAIGRDFFRTTLGNMLILPRVHWDKMDQLSFIFNENQIYQTVYNINYVSFYLTLLLPIFGLLFIKSIVDGKKEKLSRKIIWGGLVVLLFFNLIGSASSGGYLGMAIVVAAAIVILYRKILSWWKPIAVLTAVALIIGIITLDRWVPELTHAIKGTIMNDSQIRKGNISAGRSYVDYVEVVSQENTIKMGIDGNELIFKLGFENGIPTELNISDADGMPVELENRNEEKSLYSMIKYPLNDSRFKNCSFGIILNKDEYNYIVITTDDRPWIFIITDDGIYYVNGIGKRVEMKKIDAIGFKNNQHFGSSRGYIWSRTIPMMKDTFLIGRGADTYCIYFPHNDYAGKYNADLGDNLIVDKPHNMYMHMSVGTGGISLVAFLVLLSVYFVQSFNVYRNRKFDNFMEYAGLGIFLGILGFSVSGLVNDSSVSVMPLFYGLFGVGIAINIHLTRIP